MTSKARAAFNLAPVIEAPSPPVPYQRVYRMPYPNACQPPVAALFFQQDGAVATLHHTDVPIGRSFAAQIEPMPVVGWREWASAEKVPRPKGPATSCS